MSIKKMSLQQKRELPDDKGHCLYGLMTMKETSNKLRAPSWPPAKNLGINFRLHENVSVKVILQNGSYETPSKRCRLESRIMAFQKFCSRH